MSGRNGLISTAELADILGQADLRLFDCTTYLEPAPEGSSHALSRRARTSHVRSRAYSGRGFSGSAGRVLRSQYRASLHDAGCRAARGCVRPARRIQRQPGGAVQHRHADVGDAVLVDAHIARLRERRGARRRSRQMEARRPRRSKPDRRRDIRRRRSRQNRRADFSSTSTKRSPPPPSAAPSSSTRSARNSTRAWSPAATAGPAAFPAVATCRRRRCSIPQTKAFVPLAEAEAKFKAQGITKDKRVVAYCGGGISATIDLFLLHQLGYDNLTLYDGSMGEWAKDTSLPIETG